MNNSETVFELGQASIRVELEDGIISIYHGTDGDLLKTWVSSGRDWDEIFELFSLMEKRADKNTGDYTDCQNCHSRITWEEFGKHAGLCFDCVKQIQ